MLLYPVMRLDNHPSTAIDRPDPVTTGDGRSIPAEADPTRARRHRESAILWLVGASAIVALAAILDTSSSREVVLPGGIALPEVCWFHRLLGVDCAACGLTRSFIHMAHGRFASAAAMHPFGPLLFLYTLIQIGLAAGYYRCGQTARYRTLIRWNASFLATITAIMLVVWCVRLVQ
ncbi:MAG: DUF2752 domain-containing protein [Planctomycetota bacterium]|nr:MAG: DUF2752 domain-containing protein [Planctomycetota bacterium]